MPNIHPTITAILEGRKLKTNTKLDLGDIAWSDAWAVIEEHHKPVLAKQWLRQLHARATHSRSLDDDLCRSLVRHGEWVSLLWPHIHNEWFSNQNLGGHDGQLATQLGLLKSNNPELLRFSWMADAKTRAAYIANSIFVTNYSAELANFSEFLEMSRHPTILPRLWAGALSTGVTPHHESVMARLVAARSLGGTSNSLAPPQFRAWDELGKQITISRAYTVYSEVDSLRSLIAQMSLAEALIPLAATLERANTIYSRGDTLLHNSGLTPAGIVATPYSVLRQWFPEYTRVWDAAESLEEPATAVVCTLLAQQEKTINQDISLPNYEL